jgi:UDP-N-acetylmuramate--alanine ligase
MQRRMGRTERIHFVGAGGIGMSGIAEVLINLGYKISGSDIKKNSIMERLASLGAIMTEGHKVEHVHEADVVVYSSAIKQDNPELQEAVRLQIPVIPRAEMLAELMRMKYSIAISGAHGKTSTTSLTANIFHKAKLDPTAVIGGRLKIFGSNARLGQGDYLIAEADESDKSFLKLLPTIAVVTNIDEEHLDTYSDIEDIKKAFIEFVNKVPFYGAAVLCIDDQHTQEIIPQVKRRIITYGLSSQSDVTAVNIQMDKFKTAFDVVMFGEQKGRIEQNIPGLHSVYNSLAALTVANEVGIDFETSRKALAEFENAERRVEMKGDIKGIMVLDDYGHHPTEIIATLKGIKEGWQRRLIVVFQPHRYSRTQALMDRFERAFYQSDVVIVTNIYAASEKPIPGVKAEDIAEGIKKYGHKEVYFEPELTAIPSKLLQIAREGDVVLTLGAGDVWKVSEEFVKLLKKD